MLNWRGCKDIIPQALQIVWPCSSLRQSGVIVVAQFWHATTTVVLGVCWSALISIGSGAFGLSPGWHDIRCPAGAMEMFADFETRLLNAGQPPQPEAPPVPLHFPPPGQEPPEVLVSATYVAVAFEKCVVVVNLGPLPDWSPF